MDKGQKMMKTIEEKSDGIINNLFFSFYPCLILFLNR